MEERFTLQTAVPLAPLTTLKIGGNARYFVRAETEDAVVASLTFADERGLAVFILGGGSNILVADAGFDGLVLQIAVSGVESTESGSQPSSLNSQLISAGAGEVWDDFVAKCVANHLAGVECMSGIPGFVGGTPVQNVGAYGQEVAETIVSVRCLDRNSLEVVELTNADCGFSYRTSIFNSSQRNRYIVLSVTFSLNKGGTPKVAYKDLKELFGDRQPSLQEVRETVVQIRRAKSMVIDAGDVNSQSAGSFFKNPIVSREQYATIREKYEGIPSFEFGEAMKIPAAWLIENAGFCKGFVLGNAGISTNHTLALVNRGGATSQDVLSLMAEIQRGVEGKFGLLLQPEPVFVGF